MIQKPLLICSFGLHLASKVHFSFVMKIVCHCTQIFEFVDDRKSGKKSREDETKSGMTLFATHTIQVEILAMIQF